MDPKPILCEIGTLNDGATRQRIQVFPPASETEYAHPKMTFTLTDERLQEFAADINSRDSIPIDRDHAFSKRLPAPAAGWFVPGSAEVTAEGVFADVEWTPSAADQVRNREYRFISPEFSFANRRNDGKVIQEPRLMAAALTNRPFFSEMQPIAAEDEPDAEIVAELVEDGLLLAEDSDDPVQIEAAMSSSKKPYGNVAYADPGYQSDGKHRYPIDTADHVRAAWSYINKAKNAGKYAAEQLSKIKARIRRAAKKFGVTIGADATEGGTMDLTALAEAFGLSADASEDDVLEAAKAVAAENADLKTKQEETDKQLQTLIADATAGAKAAKDLAEMKRDAAIKGAIEAGKIVPAESEFYTTLYDKDPEGVEKLLAEKPVMVGFTPVGDKDARVYDANGNALKAGENGEAVTADLSPSKVFGEDVPVDEASAKIDAAAKNLLRSRGKATYTADEYALACEEAISTLGISR